MELELDFCSGFYFEFVFELGLMLVFELKFELPLISFWSFFFIRLEKNLRRWKKLPQTISCFARFRLLMLKFYFRFLTRIPSLALSHSRTRPSPHLLTLTLTPTISLTLIHKITLTNIIFLLPSPSFTHTYPNTHFLNLSK